MSPLAPTCHDLSCPPGFLPGPQKCPQVAGVIPAFALELLEGSGAAHYADGEVEAQLSWWLRCKTSPSGPGCCHWCVCVCARMYAWAPHMAGPAGCHLQGCVWAGMLSCPRRDWWFKVVSQKWWGSCVNLEDVTAPSFAPGGQPPSALVFLLFQTNKREPKLPIPPRHRWSESAFGIREHCCYGNRPSLDIFPALGSSPCCHGPTPCGPSPRPFPLLRLGMLALRTLFGHY